MNWVAYISGQCVNNETEEKKKYENLNTAYFMGPDLKMTLNDLSMNTIYHGISSSFGR